MTHHASDNSVDGARGVFVITLNAGRITLGVLIAIFFLAFASVVGQVSKYAFGHGGLLGLVPLFDLGEEANVPTWFSSALLLTCAAWLGMIAFIKHRIREPFARHWGLLALIFLFLSLDETAGIHDELGGRLRDMLRVGGIFYYAWVLPGCIFIAVVAIAYARFLFSLPRVTRRLVILAATAYVGGALGMEMIAALHDEVHGHDNPTTAVLITIEEILEMVGVTIFMHALMGYTQSAAGNLLIRTRLPTAVATPKTSDPAAGIAPLPPDGAPGSAGRPRYPRSSARPA